MFEKLRHKMQIANGIQESGDLAEARVGIDLLQGGLRQATRLLLVVLSRSIEYL